MKNEVEHISRNKYQYSQYCKFGAPLLWNNVADLLSGALERLTKC